MTIPRRPPERIQLRRTKGWRKPEGAIVVARPTRWGNPFQKGEQHPFRANHPMTVDDVVGLYRSWITEAMAEVCDLADLAGRDLACWCPLDQPCHADVLLELANG